MPLLPLDADQLLTTTRAVRKRLDFSRPVDDQVIRECVEIAMQSPSGSNNMTMQYDIYRSLDGVYIGSIEKGGERENQQQQRSAASADFLADHMGDAPALVLACNKGSRVEGAPAAHAAPRAPAASTR